MSKKTTHAWYDPAETDRAASGITAYAGGGQANAPLLIAQYNRVETVATIADSVKLPPATVGLKVVVINNAANSTNVFPSSGDIINALAADTALACAGGKATTFYCCKAGYWNSQVGA